MISVSHSLHLHTHTVTVRDRGIEAEAHARTHEQREEEEDGIEEPGTLCVHNEERAVVIRTKKGSDCNVLLVTGCLSFSGHGSQ